jgi:polar amino acid transport system substrate-binding protein
MALAGCLGEPPGEGGSGGGNGSSGGDGSGGGNGSGGNGSSGNGSGGGNGSEDNASGGGGGETTTITAGTAPGFPPFEIKEGGELTGFDVELLEAVVAAAPGYELGGWQEFEFSGLIPALTNDRIDVIAAAMTITEERKQTIAFSDPYYEADQSVLVREGGDFSPQSLDDLGGHPIGAQKGTTGEDVVKTELIEAGTLNQSNYKAYGNYTLAVQDLQNNNIDAIVLDKPVAQTFQAQRDVTVAFTYETGEQYGFGLRDGDEDLTTAINEGLATVQDDGTYEELRNEWFSGS